MNLNAILEDIRMLPPEKQEEVADFVSFIKMRLGIKNERAPIPTDTVKSKGFFGMWADREDMSDSTSWVREQRSSEWGSRNA